MVPVGDESRQGFAGSSGSPRHRLSVLRVSARFVGGGSASTLTHVVVVRIQVLVGCGPAAPLISCHVGLSIAQLTTWQFASPWKESQEPGREGTHKVACTAFCNLVPSDIPVVLIRSRLLGLARIQGAGI